MGQGFAGHIGIIKEPAWSSATAVTSGQYVEALSENITATYDRFDYKNIIASMAEPDDAVGVLRIAGDVVAAAHPITMGHFLRGVFYSTSVTAVASGVLWKTQFLTPKSNYSAASPIPGYTIETFRDVTSSQRYSGCVINGLRLDAAPNQDLRMTASVIGRNTTNIAKTTATFPGSPAKPFTFDTCSIGLNGSGTDQFEAVSITIDNQMEGIPALNASSLIAKMRRRAHQTINISGTVDFSDIVEYTKFLNQSEQALTLNFTKANSFALNIIIPRMVYTAYPLGVPGRERTTVAFEGKGFFHSGSGTAIEVALTTTKSNY